MNLFSISYLWQRIKNMLLFVNRYHLIARQSGPNPRPLPACTHFSSRGVSGWGRCSTITRRAFIYEWHLSSHRLTSLILDTGMLYEREQITLMYNLNSRSFCPWVGVKLPEFLWAVELFPTAFYTEKVGKPKRADGTHQNLKYIRTHLHPQKNKD